MSDAGEDRLDAADVNIILSAEFISNHYCTVSLLEHIASSLLVCSKKRQVRRYYHFHGVFHIFAALAFLNGGHDTGPT